MCGGDIDANLEQTIGTCDSCGSTMTLPKVSDERIANLYNRANHYRQQNEFDKALATYENILAESNIEAEAHWGVVLSKFGIEYIEDPATHKRVPTCHRVQNESILVDLDYKAALANAINDQTKQQYIKEAMAIAEIQKSILEIANNESPYDVFICYKETDEKGERTKDSVIAQDIYFQLAEEGYKVFFSRITLEDKLGTEYEPYIFAALNSAKVMLVIGTAKEHFEAVWVKNEWNRFLALSRSDKKKLIIPCYRDINAYDLPDALSMFQSQDMSKIGFIQDLVRGIKKVIIKEEIFQEPSKAMTKEIPKSSGDWDFYMEVQDVFAITGRGTVVTGEIQVGQINVGDDVKILRTGITVNVTGIEMFRKLLNSANAGDNVGLLLKGISKDDVQRGDVITRGVGEAIKVNLYKVILENPGVNKIKVIKAVRDATEAGLKEAKDAVDAAPSILKANITKSAADNFKGHFEQTGAVIGIYEQDKEVFVNHTLKVDGSGGAKQGGCYIATAVYGSYDCPQVWTLRRYRDDILSKSWQGRVFTWLYYKVSPIVVRMFGKTEWFNNIFKKKLDAMTASLNANGVANTLYKDKDV
jgi:ribosomal protein L7/L12/tetratricopeptide (TPR) repeat protein